METAGISVRVADFLKKHPPFSMMADADLVALAAGGRVRFHEPHEYVLCQGEPHKLHIFVIQQGTVSLWDETGEHPQLRDVRGEGDLLGTERYNGARGCSHSARSESDVVLYTFPGTDFEALLQKYPRAEQYIVAEGHVSSDYQTAGDTRDVHAVFLHELVANQAAPRCTPEDSIQDAARRLRDAGSESLAVVDAEQRLRGVLSRTDLVDWIAEGGGHLDRPVSELLHHEPARVAPNATVVDGLLVLAGSPAGALAITEGGRADGVFQGLVTPPDLSAVFGEQPITLLHEIRTAASTRVLRALNHRARTFALQYLASARNVGWLARFLHLTDVSILRRLVCLAGAEALGGCWCFRGAAGRSEALPAVWPETMLVLGNGHDHARAYDAYERVLEAMLECGYLPGHASPYDRRFFAASVSEWTDRYHRWLRDPIGEATYLARSVFDLRPVHGDVTLWSEIETAVMPAVDRDFVFVLANDCLTSLPPLTFFQDAVVEKSGEQTAVFHLEENALDPLVDVGRVFAMASRAAMGRSTFERLAAACTLLPEKEAIFREASETLRVVLWLQGRIGIGQGTDGASLPPALLSRNDRQILKGGFRSIGRLLEVAADPAWIETLD